MKGFATPIAALLTLGSASTSASAADPAVIKESAANLPGFNVYRPAAAPKGAKLPVIVWANGGCVRADATWTTLFERWARAGCFVVTVSQLPGAAATARSTPEDQAAALDWAVKENSSAASPYRGVLDTSRLAVAGNSCGGITALTVASRDRRLKSVFVLSGSSVGPGQKVEAAQPIMSKVSAPVLYVVGGPEDVATGPARMDYDLLPKGGAGVVVNRSSADHRTVSTDPGMLRDAAEISLTWFNATLKGDRAARKTLTSSICAGCDSKTWSVKSKNF